VALVVVRCYLHSSDLYAEFFCWLLPFTPLIGRLQSSMMRRLAKWSNAHL
jgi:hypothetical protein